MEELKVSGLVVSESQINDADKIITIICNGHGKVHVYGKGIRGIRNRHMPSTQLFSYANFVLRKGRRYYYIIDSSLIEAFIGLRCDLDCLALASYFSDIIYDLTPEGVCEEELLRLTLNSFYAMSEKKEISLKKIKASYEFKAACIAGFAPSLDGCLRCGISEHNKFYIDIMNGGLVCSDCRQSVALENTMNGNAVTIIHLPVTSEVIKTLRFIESANEKQFLSYNIDGENLDLLSQITERYLTEHIEHGFASLDFYKKILID